MNIYEHRDKVFEIYFNEFYEEGQQVRLCEQIRLREQLDGLLKLETTDMPYWFVCRLKNNGFKIN